MSRDILRTDPNFFLFKKLKSLHHADDDELLERAINPCRNYQISTKLAGFMLVSIAFSLFFFCSRLTAGLTTTVNQWQWCGGKEAGKKRLRLKGWPVAANSGGTERFADTGQASASLTAS
mgnify:CR=1 FL=1